MILIRAALLTWFLCFSGLAWAESRVALVIGNAGYASVERLINPPRDAESVADALRAVGFKVEVELDLGRDAMLKALRSFEERAEKADWALVYFAGHGIEVGGVNYLIPIDAMLASDRDVDEETVSLHQVQKRLEGVRQLRIVILDACRNNPFLTAMRRTLASRMIGRGLGRPELPQTGSLVAFSAGTGEIASDGVAGERNSPYVAALMKHLAVPDLEVNLFFRRVRMEVLRATGNKQEPATYESLPDDRFVFRPAANIPVESKPAPAPPQAPIAALAPAEPKPTPAPAPIAALAPVVPLPVIAPMTRDLVAACDRLAASPKDRDRPRGIAGIAQTAIDTKAAEPACRKASEAVQADPAAAVQVTAGETPAPGVIVRRRILYQLGRTLHAQKNYGEARQWYVKAVAAGSGAGMTNLGLLYEGGLGVDQDYTVAKTCYEKAAAVGEVDAMTNLGTLYYTGRGVAEDYEVAKTWYENAVAVSDTNAMIKLGALYHNGHGVAQDYTTARTWYEKAADAGNTEAMKILGFLYHKAQGVARDNAAARSWYVKAADAGDVEAMIQLGNFYHDGQGFAQDFAAARTWYVKAANTGSAMAMRRLGQIFANGMGVVQDYKIARTWHEKAADAGEADSMYDLGLYYEDGKGVSQDYKIARTWHEKAAEAGNVYSMYNLGQFYANGEGVTRNYKIARNWFEKADAAGHIIARWRIQKLDRDFKIRP